MLFVFSGFWFFKKTFIAYKGINWHLGPIFKVGLIVDRNCKTFSALKCYNLSKYVQCFQI